MSSDISGDNSPPGLSGHAFASLFQAVGGLRNVRAVAAMLGCTFAGIIVVGALFAITRGPGFFSGLLAMIIWIVAIGTAVNAAGLLQMDHARGISPRSTADALLYGLMCIPKLIALVLAFVAVEIVVFIVLAVLLVLCKIPFLGPVLFALVFPLSVVVAGVTVTGLFLCMVLSLPAIWQGAGIARALAQTFAIVRSRLVEAVLLLVFVGLLCFAVGMIVFGVLGAGLLPTLAMSVGIVGFGGFGVESLIASAGSGYTVAGTIGGALLWAVAASLVGQVYLLGLSLVYLRVTEGLDLTASEAALRATFDEARRRTAELGDKARQAATPRRRRRRRRGRSGHARAGAAAMHEVAPAHDAPSRDPAAVYNPPPAYSPPPTFGASAAAPPVAAMRGNEEITVGPEGTPAGGDPRDPDIALPFDEPAAAPAPVSTAPVSTAPAWSPPTTPSAPVPAAAAPLPPAPPLPAATTCPQCLSPVSADDVFCGVCGYRLK